MLIIWAVYAAMFSTMVGIAARAITDRRLVSTGVARTVWSITLMVSALVPLLTLRRLRDNQRAESHPRTTATAPDRGFNANNPRFAPMRVRVPAQLAVAASRYEAVFLGSWVIASGVLVLLVLGQTTGVRWQVRGRPRRTLAGEPVVVTRTVGPAAVGVVRSRILVPAWVFSLPEPQQRCIAMHEAEHLRHRDPAYLVTAAMAVCLFPWNPALWWQWRRLQIAIEFACDARVVRQLGETTVYASTLLVVARQRSASRHLLTHFVGRASALERRLHALVISDERRLPHAGLRSLVVVLPLTIALWLPILELSPALALVRNIDGAAAEVVTANAAMSAHPATAPTPNVEAGAAGSDRTTRLRDPLSGSAKTTTARTQRSRRLLRTPMAANAPATASRAVDEFAAPLFRITPSTSPRSTPAAEPDAAVPLGSNCPRAPLVGRPATDRVPSLLCAGAGAGAT